MDCDVERGAPRVLVVDDDDLIRDMVSTALRYAGYRTSVARDGAGALARVADVAPDLVVLDVLMPGMDGLQVCRRLRDSGHDVPVVFLTARAGSRDVLEGFARGADDYVKKPFVLDELLARVRAVLTRSGRRLHEPLLRIGDVTLDQDGHSVTRSGAAVELTPTEFDLLRYLMLNAGKVVTKPQILDRVWQYDFAGDGHVVETYVSSLRRKLDRRGDPSCIRTVRGVGYCFTVPAP